MTLASVLEGHFIKEVLLGRDRPPDPHAPGGRLSRLGSSSG
jgi:hypothetical protein